MQRFLCLFFFLNIVLSTQLVADYESSWSFYSESEMQLLNGLIGVDENTAYFMFIGYVSKHEITGVYKHLFHLKSEQLSFWQRLKTMVFSVDENFYKYQNIQRNHDSLEAISPNIFNELMYDLGIELKKP